MKNKIVVVRERKIDDVVILDVSGPLTDKDDCRALHRPVQNILKRRGKKNLVLNLSGCRTISHSGVRSLSDLFAITANRGGTMKFADPRPRVAEKLRSVGFRDLFGILSEKKAVAGFRPVGW